MSVLQVIRSLALPAGFGEGRRTGCFLSPLGGLFGLLANFGIALESLVLGDALKGHFTHDDVFIVFSG
jgi:hypothetical protein